MKRDRCGTKVKVNVERFPRKQILTARSLIFPAIAEKNIPTKVANASERSVTESASHRCPHTRPAASETMPAAAARLSTMQINEVGNEHCLQDS